MPVLGKRTRNTSPSPTTTPRVVLTRRRVNVNASPDERVLLTPEPSPNPKRPRPTSSIISAPFDDDSNKENIPPKPTDLPESRSRVQQRVSPQTHPSPPSTPHVVRNRTYLRPQSQESTTPLIGRDQERSIIHSFLDPFLTGTSDEKSPVGLYISGAPGTGKTALINELISSISVGSVRTIFVNCMTLETRDLNGVWERCATELRIAKNGKRTNLLKNDWPKQFAKLFDDRKCLLVLDEIDNLISPTCSLSNVFDIATSSARLRMIGISNMHVLNNSKPIHGIQTLHFEPYTAAQMKAVLTSRLAAISADSVTFPVPTIALLCMKIASQTGDIRMLFSVARRALDLAMHGSAPTAPSIVSPAQVLAALKLCSATSQGKTGTETIDHVRNLGLQARFALASLLIGIRRLNAGLALSNANSTPSPNGKTKRENAASAATSSIPTIDSSTLHGFYTTLLDKGSFSSVGKLEFVDLINLLEGNGLVQLGVSRKNKSKHGQTVSIASGVREEELIRGLIGDDGEKLDVKEEEINHMWHREIARIERETKLKVTSHSKPDCGGAHED